MIGFDALTMSFKESESARVPAEGMFIPPYYATREEIEALRLEVQTVDPEKRKELEALQRKASELFISEFGGALSDDQRVYLRADNVVIADPSALQDLSARFGEKIEQTSRLTLLEGKQFSGYQIRSSTFGGVHMQPDSADEMDVLGGDAALHLWAGRIPVVPLLAGFEKEPMSEELLVGEREWEAGIDAAGGNIFKSAPAYVATRLWSGAALHEKIHGIQRYDLPFPILEIVAHYYSNEAFTRAGLRSLEQSAFGRAHRWWGALANEIGPDLHAFVFGNTAGPRDAAIRSLLMERMTLATLEKLFSDDGGIHDSVVWIASE